MRYKLLSFTLFFSTYAFSQTTQTGVVTRLVSISDFDLNGTRVFLAPTILVVQRINENSRLHIDPDSAKLYAGEVLEIEGSKSKKRHGIQATTVVLPLALPRLVSGNAIVEALLPAGGGNPNVTLLLRADAYEIGITAETKMDFDGPMAQADIAQGVLLRYEGEQREPGGSILAKKVKFTRNIVSEALAKEKAQWEPQSVPVHVTQSAPQSVPVHVAQSAPDSKVSESKPSKFRLFADEALQQRVTAVGDKLIPAYQRALPTTDPTRINFRFYVIDAPKATDAFALPSGIILIPSNVARRMQNDSQLASLLADKIAMLLEGQPVPLPSGNRLDKSISMTAANLIPIIGLPMDVYSLGSGVYSVVQARDYLLQRQRVSLSLLHEAGFDLLEAPKAWWLLSQKKPKDFSGTIPPSRALTMYEILGSIWLAKQ